MVKVNLSYYIQNPLLCVAQIQDQLVEKNIAEVANAAIAAIIRSSTLGDIAIESKKEFRGELEQNNNFEPGTEMMKGEALQEKMHTRFMSTVRDQLLKTIGIKVLVMNIEKLRIMDKKVAKQISSQAIKIAELESQHKTLEKEGVVKREQAKIELEVTEAKAQATFVAAAKRAAAKKVHILAQSEAAYEAQRMKGKALVHMTTLNAEAEVEAYIKKSKAEYEYAQGMDKSELSRKLAVISAHLEGVKVQAKAMKGMKFSYVPHLLGLKR